MVGSGAVESTDWISAVRYRKKSFDIYTARSITARQRTDTARGPTVARSAHHSCHNSNRSSLEPPAALRISYWIS